MIVKVTEIVIVTSLVWLVVFSTLIWILVVIVTLASLVIILAIHIVNHYIGRMVMAPLLFAIACTCIGHSLRVS